MTNTLIQFEPIQWIRMIFRQFDNWKIFLGIHSILILMKMMPCVSVFGADSLFHKILVTFP